MRLRNRRIWRKPTRKPKNPYCWCTALMGLAIVVLVVSFLVLLLLDVPVAYCIGMATLLTMVVAVDFVPAASTTAQRIATGLDSFTLLAIPFFILVESTGGALLPLGARFRPPLIKPDMQNYRIRLSDKIMFSPTEGPWSLAQGISSHTSCIALRVGSAPTPRTEPCACDRATGESASSCVHLCLHRRD